MQDAGIDGPGAHVPLAGSKPPVSPVSKRGIPANRYLIYFFLAASGLAADLATKHWIFAWPELRQGGIHWLWENHVGFQISLNEGALFGFGQGLVWLYVAVALVAIVGILAWLFIYQAAQDLWLLFALGSITAGVLGNLYDRLGLPGEIWPPQSPRAGQAVHAVRDWILIQWSNQWRWPNFNIADSLLVIGAGIVLYHTLWLAPTPSKQ